MVGILEIITLSDISFGGCCNLFHHGTVQDCLQKKTFEFLAGNLYGIIGEFGEGGAALSCGITGNTNYYEGEIYFDGIEKSIKDLIDISWYIGNDLYQSRKHGLLSMARKIKKNTIREQIEYGVQSRLTELDFSSIQEMFSISNERVERNIEFLSGERWKSSVAIGYSNGKRIFCYPWMNSKDIEHLKEQLSDTVKVLLDAGCIVIMPTTKEENIKKVCNEGHSIFI